MSDWLTLKNDLNLTLRPIDAWPGTLRPSWQRETGPYSASLKDTLKMLRTELNALRATEIVLQVAFRERDLRLDGLPRANAIAEHPGVILSFRTSKGHMRRAFDRFSKWQHNLRALAMNMEHLRLANLYGVEADDTQYAGWKALPPGGAAEAPPQDDLRETLIFLFVVSQRDFTPSSLTAVEDDPAQLRMLVRGAQARAHPDAGGNADLFGRVQSAVALLKEKGLL